MSPCLRPPPLGFLVLALVLGGLSPWGRAAPPATKPKGPAAEALLFDSWKLRLLGSSADESLKASEVREDPEKVNGSPCVAYDFEGTITGKLYPLLVGRLDVPSDMSQHHAIVFSYKILVKSAEAGIPWWAWAYHHERVFDDAYRSLGMLDPTYSPRATGHVPEMILLMERLVAAGHAYATDSGDVYFDVRSFPEYGSLSRQRLDDMQPAGDSAADANKVVRVVKAL